MPLAVGSRLGPYEILAPIGAGGMGEVWRARDTKLARDVALKVLPEHLSDDPKALARFESEAKAVAALSHPNILAIHDFGRISGVSFAVMELLEGQTLRSALAPGPMPPRRALEIARQVAEALAAAHEKGIVHRDVKPDNVFLTKDGHARLLDFGLARHERELRNGAGTGTPTLSARTEPGAVVGTVAYMSPEQARGLPVDLRSDQFSLGVVLYEMLAGTRPFRGDTAAETITAILREEPEPLERAAPTVAPPVRWIVERCLAKDPASRFASTIDLARDLETCRQHLSEATAPSAAPGPARARGLSRVGLVLLAVCAAGLFLWSLGTVRPPVPSFKRITLRRGRVDSARFTPDFQSVVYSARWEGKASELFVQGLSSIDARPLAVPGASSIDVVGTAGGDVAIVRDHATLARLPLQGGTPRELVEGVYAAAWDPTGTRLAIVRVLARDSCRLEYPPGKVLFAAGELEWIGNPRLSPDLTRVAFVFHRNRGDDSGDLCVVGPDGKRRTLLEGWGVIGGLAWSPDGNEIWFTGSRKGIARELHAVDLSGRERLVMHLPGNVGLQDIAPDGRVLVNFALGPRSELRGRMAGDPAERTLSWLDGTVLPILAPDGTQMVFQEWGEGGGGRGSTYYWRMDGSAPVRLGDGAPSDVSPDWKTVLVAVGQGEDVEGRLMPIGAGETVTLPRGPIRTFSGGRFLPDGKRIVAKGAGTDGLQRLFLQDLDGSSPRPFTTVTTQGMGPISPDGRTIVARPSAEGPFAPVPLDGGELRPMPPLPRDEWPLVFGDDGTSLYLTSAQIGGKFPIRVTRLDLRTGDRTPWLELAPPDPAGVTRPFGVRLTPNGRFYTYGFGRTFSDLYVVEGLR